MECESKTPKTKNNTKNRNLKKELRALENLQKKTKRDTTKRAKAKKKLGGGLAIELGKVDLKQVSAEDVNDADGDANAGMCMTNEDAGEVVEGLAKMQLSMAEDGGVAEFAGGLVAMSEFQDLGTL